MSKTEDSYGEALVWVALLPTTINYLVTLPFQIVFTTESREFFWIILLCGFGLWSAWHLGFNFRNYLTNSFPEYHAIGLAGSVFGAYLIWNFFGGNSLLAKGDIKKLAFLFFMYGGAPIVMSSALLSILLIKKVWGRLRRSL